VGSHGGEARFIRQNFCSCLFVVNTEYALSIWKYKAQQVDKCISSRHEGEAIGYPIVMLHNSDVERLFSYSVKVLEHAFLG